MDDQFDKILTLQTHRTQNEKKDSLKKKTLNRQLVLIEMIKKRHPTTKKMKDPPDTVRDGAKYEILKDLSLLSIDKVNPSELLTGSHTQKMR